VLSFELLNLKPFSCHSKPKTKHSKLKTQNSKLYKMHSIDDLIKIALAEDIGPKDITTENLISPAEKGKAVIAAKEPLIIAGLEAAKRVFEHLESPLVFSSRFRDGDAIQSGDIVLEIEGKMRTLLMGERTALNFLQHLSGIATLVRSWVQEIDGSRVRLVDTRKTTPGLRSLEKYAVRIGGAFNHRTGLYDGVLIKDNHIAAAGGIVNAVEKIRREISHLIKIEVEASNLDQVREALQANVDVIMLDNMDLDHIREAVAVINHRVLVEISGNVTKARLAQLADTGADIISSGALTHSARSMDLSMRIQRPDGPV
jgi:nicotinate-nucleotide pyrophosphorylase (carboxylating)